MKKQLTILVALALLVSALAAFAEEAATDSAQTAEAVEATEATEVTEVTEATEAMEAGPELPFDDGAWLTSASAGSTIYLPADWTIAEEERDRLYRRERGRRGVRGGGDRGAGRAHRPDDLHGQHR